MLSLAFTLLASLVSPIDANAGNEKWTHADSNITLQYDGEQNGRYQNVSVIRHGKRVRRLALSERSNALFEHDAHPATSPDGRYVLITDVESGDVTSSDGDRRMHEVAYCGFINTHSGCMVARQTGQFCGGSFNDAGQWVFPGLLPITLAEEGATAEDYASGRRSPSDAPDGSLDNLLRCDPPGPRNRDHYRRLIEAGIFHVTPAQRQALYGR